MFVVLFSALLVLLHTDYVHAQGVPISEYNQIPCFNSANYTSGDRFQSNLKLLLSTLVSNGTPDGFFNTSIGSQPDIVYGLVQCRGGIIEDDCGRCLNVSATRITQRCPNQKVAAQVYDHCTLHYSNTRFFSQVDVSIIKDEYNPESGYLNSTVLQNSMKDLLSVAASRTNKFEQRNFDDPSSSKKIKGLVQCTRDLSRNDCSSCLDSLISHMETCCESSRGAKIFSPSCYLNFETENINVQTAPTGTGSGNTGTGSGTSPDIIVDKSKVNVAAIVAPTVATIFLVGVCIFFTQRARRNKRQTKRSPLIPEKISAHGDDISEESLQYDFDAIRMATNDFSDANKLGEGGFGSVYKGELLNGVEIAVKRLSKTSRQQEFRNEVMLLYKLQHRNLVRLFGFCFAGEEKLLIYEYVPNRSLDKYIFDESQDSYLDWETRYKIIGGITRALLYLHEDSRLRIVHRDLKAGNILLDEEMNAKVADFGLAKLFGVDQTRGMTSAIAGTLGYMAPEYLSGGLYSVKSDVFSFGVLLLEIISGQSVSNFNLSGQSWSLLSHAWNLWRKGDALDILDQTLVENVSADQALRCIHIALLCVQNDLESRPSMSSIILMFNSYSLALDSPRAPAFYLENTVDINNSSRLILYSEDGPTHPR